MHVEADDANAINFSVPTPMRRGPPDPLPLAPNAHHVSSPPPPDSSVKSPITSRRPPDSAARRRSRGQHSLSQQAAAPASSSSNAATRARLGLATTSPRHLFATMFSPRSSNYERLEGGMGPSRNNPVSIRRFGWKRFAVGAVVIVGLVWVFGPRKEDIIPEKYEKYIPNIPSEFFSLVSFVLLRRFVLALGVEGV